MISINLRLLRIDLTTSFKHETNNAHSMIMLFRALIRTHHMTSRKKIAAIAKAAKKYECAVYLKTGAHPPGVMISESEVEGMEGLAGWIAAVKVG